MKKIGIVSCYFQRNYGSLLQAYATQMILDKLGLENETIDISGFNSEIKKAKMFYFIKASFTTDILSAKLGRAKNEVIKRFSKDEYAEQILIRNRAFDTFSKQYFRLSERYESKEELGKKCDEKYSVVLVGSDQLWLPGNIAANYYTLNFVPQSVNTIAYSTSFGVSALPKDSVKKAQVFLRKIKHIGVREESGQKLVETLTGRKVPVVCDPTLLFTGEEWLSIQQKEAIIKEPYIFCYFLGNNVSHREFARRLKELTGLKIVALTHIDEIVESEKNFADENPYDISPVEFLNLVRNATYVCTDSFHCSVFSILYSREFFLFRRFATNTMQSTNSRLDTLINLVGIQGRIKNGDEDVRVCIESKIEYKPVLAKLVEVREASYQYLLKAIEDNGSTDYD